jgi:hypothetical protein
VILLVLSALEHFTLNAQFVVHQLLFWLMEMNAEECALELTTGDPQITHANPVLPLVSIVLELELMIVTVA